LVLRVALTIAFTATLTWVPISQAAAGSCPDVLGQATRLALVVTPSMDATKAVLHTFERDTPATSWVRHGAPEPSVVGSRGIAWGETFRSYARDGEPIKREGDNRTPAGVYRFGRTFGFAKSKVPGYLRLTPGANFCVHDTRSRLYGHIVPRSTVGKKIKGEELSAFPLYKTGIVIDYPPDRKAKAGSCIFVHIWGGEGVGTSGCVALPEARVAHLQDWARKRPYAAMAVLHEGALPRFGDCLPALEGSAEGNSAQLSR
jgi:L,D-peptidoglycan transpeptidase YkuD (ErfK/YbiS/YcfS/YnhG family)